MTHEQLIAAGYNRLPTEESPFVEVLRGEYYYQKIDGELEIRVYYLLNTAVIHIGNKHSHLMIFETLEQVESSARLLYSAVQGNPATTEFLSFSDFQCGDILLIDGQIVDEDDDDTEMPESIELGRSEEFHRLLAAAKAEIGGV